MRNIKRVITLLLMFICTFVLIDTSAYAVPPSNPHIESGTAADGGNFFEFDASYLGENGWRDLRTPPHWVVETGEVAYCLDHMADCPHNVAYGEFNPLTVYSERTYTGLLAIMEHSYPYRNAGLTDQQIKYATSNAIRSWLRESAGIGYDFMLSSNEAIRPKDSSAQSTYNFYLQLLDKARNGAIIDQSLDIYPDVVELEFVDGKLQGTITVDYEALNGKYRIDESRLSPGMNVSGYTGNSGDKLTFTIPIGIVGRTINLTDILIGYDNRCSENIYWFDDSGGKQAVAVPVVDKMCEVVKGTVTLKSDPSHLVITKKDSISGKNLKGAKFGIYTANDVLIEEITTDKNGTAVSDNLVFRDYYVKELVAPEGYILSDTVYSFTINSIGQQVLVDVLNDPIRGKVSVTKLGENEEKLQGAVFGIYDSYDNLIQEIASNEQGIAISNDLVYGSYYLKEISAPEGYVQNDEKLLFTISENEEMVELTVSNTLIRGKVKIIKQDDEGNPLQGVVFDIYDTNDILVEELTTNSEGMAISSDLIYGNYYLKEISAPEGYVLNEEAITFGIDEDSEIVECEIVNKKINGYVEVIKTDGDTGALLEGVVFELYDSQDVLIETITSDSNGHAKSNALEYGDYYISEVEAPEGYVLSEGPYSFSIVNDEETITLDIANEPIEGKVEIIKTDTETSENLCGAVIGIYDKGKNFIKELKTDEDGYAISSPLFFGDYYLKEIFAPEGYILSDEIYLFSITTNNQIVSLNITNEIIKGRVGIIKTEPINGNFLGEAKFGVYDGNSILIEELVTDENGSAISSELNYGTYYVKEIEAPEGYVLNEETYSFSIVNDEKTITIGISNDPIKGKMEVTKIDSRTRDNLSGAVFRLYDIDDGLIDELTTKEYGYAISSPLSYGNYYLKEISAPEGYILSDEIYPFSITSNNQIVSLDITNEIIKGRAEITKTEPISGKSLEGVKFGVFDKDNNLVEEVITDKKGKAVTSDLVYGDYYVRELEFLDGYISNNMEYQISISEDGQTIELNIQKYTCFRLRGSVLQAHRLWQ